MRLIEVHPDELQLSPELSRSGSAKQFEERLKASIEEIGLAEPIKVAPLPKGGYLVIDGTMRLRAVRAIRDQHPERFATVAAYLLDFERRFEIRYQSDIYQDLLPSQLAALVEHVHKAEQVRKLDIARYIGVSPATLRNYTGLWRLLQRGGLFARIVELMDVQVIPSSNPYAWLRLTAAGLRKVIEDNFSEGEAPEVWIERMVTRARQGDSQRYPIEFAEAITDALSPEYYRVGEDVRSVKRDLGQRKGGTAPTPLPLIDYRVGEDVRSVKADLGQPNGGTAPAPKPMIDFSDALEHLKRVSKRSPDPVLRTAAKSLQEYLQ